MAININNKIKQFFGGNWGSNKFTKKHTKIPENFGYEEHKHHGKKKKKKNKEFFWCGEQCPFCGDRLAKVDKEQKYFWRYEFVTECKCGALQVEECPCCKRKTWYNLDTQIYKHGKDWSSCGFEGKKRHEKI